ncbi:serine/threonine protein kinase [Bifidobacterium sp. 82T10]|uniref:non-specific serine/threonine protein kinase n=1 Tax=Bifidobacterium miconis TaxID=2834435 RepID=A0ABS6WC65_9BIFI|nr:serine/threonine-protein kinase [Bifidobacterium miconis]MBW3091610.1 serine/threonine protein kinase [Bifidobacterium miconis]
MPHGNAATPAHSHAATLDGLPCGRPPALPGHAFVRTLGRGSTADVHLYRTDDGTRLVAVKVSRAPLDGSARRRLVAEVRALSGLGGHPHVLAIHDAGVTDDGRGWLMLDHAPGGSLGDLLARRTLSAGQTADWGVRLAGALASAHRRGIVHRDVKPANVLIDGEGLPMLADFGVAADVYRSDEWTGHSTLWAAPEVMNGDTGGDEASDVYSLAATLFAAYAGHAPVGYAPVGYAPGGLCDGADEITGGVTGNIAGNGVDDDTGDGTNGGAHALRSADMPKDMPAPLADVLRKALSPSPAERHGSALALARDLQRVQHRLSRVMTPIVVDGIPPYPERTRAGIGVAGSSGTVSGTDPDSGPGSASDSFGTNPGSLNAPEYSGTAACRRNGASPCRVRRHAASCRNTHRRDRYTAVGHRKPSFTAAALVTAAITGSLAAAYAGMDSLPLRQRPFPAGAASPLTISDSDSAASMLRFDDIVPAPEQLTGVAQGDTVTFTWSNPDPREGDSYLWSPAVANSGDAEDIAAERMRQSGMRSVSGTTLTLRGDDAEPCVHISIMRADRRTSARPATSCVQRRTGDANDDALDTDDQ